MLSTDGPTVSKSRRSCIRYLVSGILIAVVACGLGLGFTRSTVVATKATPPAPRMECEGELQYVLQGSIPATFNYSSRELEPGLQVCVTGRSGGGAGWTLLKLKTETGEVGWIMSRHVGGWQAYLDSIDPSVPLPTATARPVRSPTPIARATPTLADAVRSIMDAIAEAAGPPRQATIIDTGIVIRNHDYAFAVDIPAGWTREWSYVADSEWVGDGSLRLRSHSHPDGASLDSLAATIRANLRADWPHALVFEVESFEKRDAVGRARYVLKYRVRESPGACLLDVEEVIMVGGSQVGPARAFRAQHRICASEEADSIGRSLLNSLSVVAVPSYYAQFLQRGDVWIKAPAQVDPRALHAAGDRVEQMLANVRPGIPVCLAEAGAELAIYPGDGYVTDLPEFAYLKGQPDEVGDPYDTYLGLGGIPGQPVSGIPEDNLLALSSDTGAWSDVTIHEFAHLIQNLCFTPAEHVQIEALYERARRLERFEGTYAMLNVEEFFAVFTTLYFNATWRLSDFGMPGSWGRFALLQRAPDVHAFMESIFNSG